MGRISVLVRDIDFNIRGKRQLYKWIKDVANREQKSIGQIDIILCTDQYLLDINQKFLSHSDYTDIISFDYSEGQNISGELFISIERIRENASKFGSDIRDELDLVIIHGILHLCGYKDKLRNEIDEMRRKETEALKLRIA